MHVQVIDAVERRDVEAEPRLGRVVREVAGDGAGAELEHATREAGVGGGERAGAADVRARTHQIVSARGGFPVSEDHQVVVHVDEGVVGGGVRDSRRDLGAKDARLGAGLSVVLGGHAPGLQQLLAPHHQSHGGEGSDALSRGTGPRELRWERAGSALATSGRVRTRVGTSEGGATGRMRDSRTLPGGDRREARRGNWRATIGWTR